MESILDILIEFILTVFVEGFVEGFVSLCTVFVPHKTISPKATKIITWSCVTTSLLLLLGLFVGIIILLETSGQSFWGWLLVGLSIMYLLVGIALKLISYIRSTSGKKK